MFRKLIANWKEEKLWLLIAFSSFKFPRTDLIAEPDEEKIAAHLEGAHQRSQLGAFDFRPVDGDFLDRHFEGLGDE